MSRLFVLLFLLLPAFANAGPDRAGLISAWEAAMRSDGALEAQADGDYRYRSESLGYDGRVRLLTAIVRSEGTPGAMTYGMQAVGSVDFELPDLPASSQGSPSSGLMSWKAERQNFFYDANKQTWLSMAEWAHAQGENDGEGASVFWSHWLRTYGVLVGVLVFLVAVLWGAARQQRRVRGLLAESHEVNRLGRENIERAASLREAQAAAMQESLELARRSAAAVEAILEELRRRPAS